MCNTSSDMKVLLYNSSNTVMHYITRISVLPILGNECQDQIVDNVSSFIKRFQDNVREEGKMG